jgi:long-subunit acyl-CoA synthetase (AMP-forming)
MEAEEVTPTLKLRRKAIMDKNTDLIEGLYS